MYFSVRLDFTCQYTLANVSLRKLINLTQWLSTLHGHNLLEKIATDPDVLEDSRASGESPVNVARGRSLVVEDIGQGRAIPGMKQFMREPEGDDEGRGGIPSIGGAGGRRAARRGELLRGRRGV